MTAQIDEEFSIEGVLMKRRLSGAETGGQFCLFDNRSQGPSQTPVHIDVHEDDTITMIEGELQVIIAG